MVTKVETRSEASELPDEEKQKTDIVKQMRSLLSTINSACKEANTSLDSLVKKVDQQEVNVRDGISILDVKYQSKLMYLINIAYLVMKRLHGQQISRNEAIERLVELRTVLERIRPLEQKLKYHIDKYIKIATRGETDPNDPTSFKANPDMMNDASDEEVEEEEGKKKKKKNKEDEDGKTGIYKPPRLTSVHYDGDETRNEKQARSLERARKRALSSNLMQELKEEYLDRPMEYSHSSSNTLKNVISQREQERQDYEETYFTRLPLEKKKKSSFNQMTLNSIGDQVTRFEDLSVLHGGGGGDYEPGAKKRKKQMIEGGKKKKGGGGKGKAKGKKKRKFK